MNNFDLISTSQIEVNSQNVERQEVAKQPYHTPSLTIHGKLERVTLQSGGINPPTETGDF